MHRQRALGGVLATVEGEGVRVNYVTPRGGKTRALNLTVPLIDKYTRPTVFGKVKKA